MQTTTLRLTLAAFAFALTAGLTTPVAAQSTSKFVREGIDGAIKQANDARKEFGKDCGLLTGQLCLLGAWLEEGAYIEYELRLKGGLEYMFVAAGDSDVVDLDLAVHVKGEEDNRVVDIEEDATPYVRIIVEDKTLDVVLQMRVHKAKASPSFCTLIMLQEGGEWASVERLRDAAVGLGKAADRSKGYSLEATPGAWCMFGGLMSEGESQGVVRDFLPGEFAILGWGDKNATDVDLLLYEDGELVLEDEGSDNEPECGFEIEERTRGTIKLKMHESKGLAFGVCCVLVADD